MRVSEASVERMKKIFQDYAENVRQSVQFVVFAK